MAGPPVDLPRPGRAGRRARALPRRARAGVPHRALGPGRSRVGAGPPRSLPAAAARYLEGDGRRLPGPVAPFNVNFRYVEGGAALPADRRPDAGAGLPRGVRPQVAAVRDRLPGSGARPGRRRVRPRAAPGGRRLRGGGADRGTRERHAGPERRRPLRPVHRRHHRDAQRVLWRNDDIYVTSMGGTPFGTNDPYTSYDAIAQAMPAGVGCGC